MPAHSDFFFCVSALVLGIVAGMRTMMAPAVLAITLLRLPEYAPVAAPARWFVLRPIAVFLGLAAVGELAADKLPWIPNRTSAGPLAGRLASGAVTGAALVQIGRINPWTGAACGAMGALVSTFGMFHARRFAGRVTGIKDPLIGAMEDVIAIALAGTVVAMLVG